MELSGRYGVNDTRLFRKILMGLLLVYSIMQLTGSISQIIDGIVVSNYIGEEAMAAFGMTVPIYSVVNIFCGIIAMGLQSVCVKFMAAGKREELEKAVLTGVTVMLAIAVVVFTVGIFFTPQICRFLGADTGTPVLYQQVKDYLKAWFIGAPGFITFTVLAPLVVLDGDQKCISLAVGVQFIINLAGDLLAAKVFHAGMFGIGLATAVDFWAAAIIVLLHFTKKNSSIRLNGFLFDADSLKQIVKYGIPAVTYMLCRIAAPICINRQFLSIGSTQAMTALSVQNNLESFLMIIGFGISSAFKIVAQVLYNENDKKNLQKTVNITFIMILIGEGSVGIFTIIFAPLLAGIYMSSDSVCFANTVFALRVFAFYLPIWSMNETILSYIHAAGKLKAEHIYNVFYRFVFIVLCVIVLGRFYGIKGLFIAYPISGLFTFLSYLISARIVGRKKKISDALLLLPEQDEMPELLNLDIHDLNDAVGVSLYVDEFCEKNGIPQKKKYYVSLCIEEMAMNFAEHGLADGKEHRCNIRLLIHNDELIIRIRDDCPLFNLNERFKTINDQTDPLANIGLKLVYGVSKDVSYIHVMNTNTITITV